MFGDIDIEKVKSLAGSSGRNVRWGTIAETARFGEIILISVPWFAAQDAIRSAGSLEGKIVIDVMNPWAPEGPGTGLAIGHTTSAAEEVAGWAPGAKVVKAFNTIGFQNFGKPQFGAQRATLFYCGDNAEAKAVVARLGEEMGFEPVDSGPLKNARCLEPMALLWAQLAVPLGMGFDIAFKLVRRQ
jgi:predicted dinucleotide-binding enzyme